MTFISKLALSAGLLYGANMVYHVGQQLYLDNKVADVNESHYKKWDEAWYSEASGSRLRLMSDLHDNFLNSMRLQHTLHEKRAINPLYGVEPVDFDPFR